ncbi:ABC transporter permease [Paenibacillus radicis (ex Xue et al. 2023)]|uniref:ABC transporter permease n=1 Tax=Paenibacillus radicis (ex Xue et al. 2023) TaxID=2972489 RepID=A0ABT1Y9T9_9BACL|nr:ABC transporter permease [Paenibacillus radicis (ex Xue et al. 2023)]MCR8629961.1 ABC transporter permease [Paenibacillus radicis (ex Xue et al. 2023)]
MSRFITLRIGQGIITLLLVSILTFFLINLAPGGPSAIMNFESTAQQREALTKQLGLDKPVVQRYFEWLGGVVKGDLGRSLDSQQPVATLLAERFPNTVLLSAATLVFTLLIGIPLGVIAAVKRGSWLDRLITFMSTFGMAIPEFWLGILLIIIFAVTYQMLPPSGMITAGSVFSLGDLAKHMIMPMLTLSILMLPNIVRFTRSAMVDVIDLDYIRTARAKGLKSFSVFFKHALRNALIPIAAIVGLIIPILLGGSVVVENVFGWPGMGRLAVQAATNRDYTVVMGLTLMVGTIVIITNIVTDLLYSVLDPRIRYE